MHPVRVAVLRGAVVALDTLADLACIAAELAERGCAHIVDHWLCPVPDDAKNAEILRP